MESWGLNLTQGNHPELEVRSVRLKCVAQSWLELKVNKPWLEASRKR